MKAADGLLAVVAAMASVVSAAPLSMNVASSTITPHGMIPAGPSNVSMGHGPVIVSAKSSPSAVPTPTSSPYGADWWKVGTGPKARRDVAFGNSRGKENPGQPKFRTCLHNCGESCRWQPNVKDQTKCYLFCAEQSGCGGWLANPVWPPLEPPMHAFAITNAFNGWPSSTLHYHWPPQPGIAWTYTRPSDSKVVEFTEPLPLMTTIAHVRPRDLDSPASVVSEPTSITTIPVSFAAEPSITPVHMPHVELRKDKRKGDDDDDDGIGFEHRQDLKMIPWEPEDPPRCVIKCFGECPYNENHCLWNCTAKNCFDSGWIRSDDKPGDPAIGSETAPAVDPSEDSILDKGAVNLQNEVLFLCKHQCFFKHINDKAQMLKCYEDCDNPPDSDEEEEDSDSEPPPCRYCNHNPNDYLVDGDSLKLAAENFNQESAKDVVLDKRSVNSNPPPGCRFQCYVEGGDEDQVEKCLAERCDGDHGLVNDNPLKLAAENFNQESAKDVVLDKRSVNSNPPPGCRFQCYVEGGDEDQVEKCLAERCDGDHGLVDDNPLKLDDNPLKVAAEDGILEMRSVHSNPPAGCRFQCYMEGGDEDQVEKCLAERCDGDHGLVDGNPLKTAAEDGVLGMRSVHSNPPAGCRFQCYMEGGDEDQVEKCLAERCDGDHGIVDGNPLKSVADRLNEAKPKDVVLGKRQKTPPGWDWPKDEYVNKCWVNCDRRCGGYIGDCWRDCRFWACDPKNPWELDSEDWKTNLPPKKREIDTLDGRDLVKVADEDFNGPCFSYCLHKCPWEGFCWHTCVNTHCYAPSPEIPSIKKGPWPPLMGIGSNDGIADSDVALKKRAVIPDKDREVEGIGGAETRGTADHAGEAADGPKHSSDLIEETRLQNCLSDCKGGCHPTDKVCLGKCSYQRCKDIFDAENSRLGDVRVVYDFTGHFDASPENLKCATHCALSVCGGDWLNKADIKCYRHCMYDCKHGIYGERVSVLEPDSDTQTGDQFDDAEIPHEFEAQTGAVAGQPLDKLGVGPSMLEDKYHHSWRVPEYFSSTQKVCRMACGDQCGYYLRNDMADYPRQPCFNNCSLDCWHKSPTHDDD